MAFKIGLISQKGGPGKSTIARGLAVGFAQLEWTAKIADFDLGQLTSTEWLRTRLANAHKPDVYCEPFGNVAQALRNVDNYDVIIFDPKGETSTITVDIAKSSDLVIIPTALALDDLRPAVVLADQIHTKHGTPVERIVFALNHVGDSDAELADAKAYLAQKPYQVLDGYLSEKVAYRRAMDIGLSILETPYKGPREQAEKLIQAVIDKVADLTN